MINRFISIFKKKEPITKKYNSLSGFFTHASEDEQKKIFTEAARRANEDQMKIFKEAQLKAN